MFLLRLLIGILLNILAYLIMPRPEQPKQEIKELDDQTSESGRPVAVAFGTVWVKSPNLLEFGDKSYRERKVYPGNNKKG